MTIDLTPYVGRWIGLVGDFVAGVGHSADEALQLARRNRPKDRIRLRFVESREGEILRLPPLLEQLRSILDQYHLPVYLVGGAVRDALLGRISKDLDFVVPYQAVKLAFHVADTLNVPAYVLDEERDTGRVILSEMNTTLDFARFRGPDLESDLRKRDFTINAIALPATAQRSTSLIDPCHGEDDLKQQRIRQTHKQAIAEDPVRALRALRLALSFDFVLTDDTVEAITQTISTLDSVSNERVRDELLKLMETSVPHDGVARMAQLGVLPIILPEIADLEGINQSPPHHEAVLVHTISVLRWLTRIEALLETDSGVDSDLAGQSTLAVGFLEHLQSTLQPYIPRLITHLNQKWDGGFKGHTLLRLSALFHDAGKKETRTLTEDGRIHFYGHEKVGAKLVNIRLRHLCLSNKAIAHVKQIVAGHMRPLWLVNSRIKEGIADRPISRRAVFRFFRDTKTAGVDIILLSLADHLATNGGPGDMERWQHLLKLTRELLFHYFEQHTKAVAPIPLLSGRDLMNALELQPGPMIGHLLRMIEEAQAAGDITSREEAIQYARTVRQ